MKKKIRAALLALMMVTALGTQAFAAQTARDYDFSFKQPYSSSWRKTSGCYNPVNMVTGPMFRPVHRRPERCIIFFQKKCMMVGM